MKVPSQTEHILQQEQHGASIFIAKDFRIVFCIGIITAICLIPVLYNVGWLTFLVVASLFTAPFLWALGWFLVYLISQRLTHVYQFAKFLVVGVLNTAIDFGVLNMLSLLVGATAGFVIGGINIPGFLLAALNSYGWNKFWVFNVVTRTHTFTDVVPFILVVCAGALINSGIIVVITTYMSPAFSLETEVWLNVAKIIATTIVLFWHFFAFKFLVFGLHRYA